MRRILFISGSSLILHQLQLRPTLADEFEIGRRRAENQFALAAIVGESLRPILRRGGIVGEHHGETNAFAL
ncbi:hypothetical protein EDS67_21015 [candidate division KSB1 bacterium]|nr:MAG: hypothetical protein EDS67_21015 [candidate division KSB1 bacterium]